MARIILIFFGVLHFSISLAQPSYENGYLKMAEGKWTEAQLVFEKAADDFLVRQDSMGYIHCRLAIGECKLRQNQYRDAIIESRQVYNLVAQPEYRSDSLQIKALLTISEGFLNLGMNADALKELQLAEAMLATAGELQTINCFNLLGLAYWNNQNKTLAIQYHELSIEKRKNYFGEKSTEVADALNNLALVYLEDDKPMAERYIRMAIEIYDGEKEQVKSKRGYTLLNLAMLRAELGWQGQAREFYDEAVAIWSDLYGGTDHPAKAYSLIISAKMHQLRGELDMAGEILEESLLQYKRIYGEKHPETANIYFLKGQILQEQGQLKKALTAFQNAIYANYAEENFTNKYELPPTTGYFNGDYLLSALMAKAKILEALHFEKTLKRRELKAALETYRKADMILDDLRTLRASEADKIRLGEIAHLIYENGIKIALTLAEQPFFYAKYKNEAFDFSERSKASLLLSAIRETEAKTFAGIPDHLLMTEDSLKQEISYYNQLLARGYVTQENKLRLFQTEKFYREFLSEMEQGYPSYFNLKHDRSQVALEDIQRKLSPREMMISYFEDKTDIWSFGITQKKLTIHKKAKPEQWDRVIKAYRNALYYKASNFEDSLGRILHTLLLPPNIPAHIDQLIIIPDGQLHQIPFEALKSGQSEYLIAKYAVKYHYSSTLWYNTKTTMHDNRGLLAIAPAFFSSHPQNLTDLPGTVAELKALGRIFDQNGYQSKLYKGDASTEQMFKMEELTAYRYIHLATHGEVNTTTPALSRVFFHSDSLDDGSLYTGEIYGLRLNANLVTLSACETGLGQIATGEGILGLSRALIYAGTTNLLVSQWKVSDNSTAELMQSFYEKALSDTTQQSYANALRLAKLDLQRNPKYQEPYYWAAFVLIGQ